MKENIKWKYYDWKNTKEKFIKSHDDNQLINILSPIFSFIENSQMYGLDHMPLFKNYFETDPESALEIFYKEADKNFSMFLLIRSSCKSAMFAYENNDILGFLSIAKSINEHLWKFTLLCCLNDLKEKNKNYVKEFYKNFIAGNYNQKIHIQMSLIKDLIPNEFCDLIEEFKPKEDNKIFNNLTHRNYFFRTDANKEKILSSVISSFQKIIKICIIAIFTSVPLGFTSLSDTFFKMSSKIEISPWFEGFINKNIRKNKKYFYDVINTMNE